MKTKFITGNVVVMVLFGALGLMRFSEGIRSVQILGLFGSGMAVGAALISIVNAPRAKPKTEKTVN